MSKFKPNTKVLIKFGSLIENLQSAPFNTGEPIINIRYWSTDPHTRQRILKIFSFSV